MKRLGFGFFAAALVLAASCYNPDTAAVRYSCDEANPYCPDGLECISDVCLPPGTPPPDGGTSAPPDGTVASRGCKSGMGFVVGTAFACPGTFGGGSPPASQLCAANFKICTDAQGVDQTACRKLSGFFGAQVNVRRSNNVYSCGYDKNNPYFGGCGQSRTSIVDVPAIPMCPSFGQILSCVADRPWTCTSDKLDNISNTNGSDGVLCCPM
jgi:hypothetical protein